VNDCSMGDGVISSTRRGVLCCTRHPLLASSPHLIFLRHTRPYSPCFIIISLSHPCPMPPPPLSSPRLSVESPTVRSCVCQGRRQCREVPLTDSFFSPPELLMISSAGPLSPVSSFKHPPPVCQMYTANKQQTSDDGVHLPCVFLMNSRTGTEFPFLLNNKRLEHESRIYMNVCWHLRKQ
jgi:hypothetical protein